MHGGHCDVNTLYPNPQRVPTNESIFLQQTLLKYCVPGIALGIEGTEAEMKQPLPSKNLHCVAGSNMAGMPFFLTLAPWFTWLPLALSPNATFCKRLVFFFLIFLTDSAFVPFDCLPFPLYIISVHMVVCILYLR